MYAFVRQWVILSCLLLFPVTIFAVPNALNVSVTAQQGQLLTIDLSNSVDGIAPISVTITTPPPSQEGTIQLNGLTIDFISALGFSGTTQFSYNVMDSDTSQPNQVATAAVTVNVTPLSIPVQTSITNDKVTPENSINNSLSALCANLSSQQSLTAEEQDLLNYCRDISQAIANGSLNEVEAALAQITPHEVATQIRAGKNISDHQMQNIGGRLAALHRGTKGATLLDVSFLTNDGYVIPGTILSDLISGGAAGDKNSPWGMFFSGVFGSIKRDKTTQEEGFNVGSYSGTFGSDFRFNRNFVVGGALGFAGSDVNVGQKAGNVNVNGVNFSGYATYYLNEKSYFDWIVSYSKQFYKTKRNIDFILNSNHVQTQAQSNTEGRFIASSFGGGYDFYTKKGINLSAKLRFDYANSSIGSYEEKNAGALNLTIESQQFDSLVSSTGVQVTYVRNTTRFVVLTQMDLDWKHEFKGDATTISGSFNKDSLATAFEFETDNPDNNYISVGLGISALFPGGNTIFTHLSSSFAKQYYNDFFLTLGGRIEF